VVNVTAIPSRSTQLNETYSDSVQTVVFSGDSAYLLVAFQTQARLISVSSGDTRAIYDHAEIETAIFSPTQNLVYTAGNRGLLRMWDVRGELRAEVALTEARLLDLCFIESGDTLVAASTGGVIYFLNAATLSLDHKVTFPKSLIYRCRPDKSGGLMAVSVQVQTGLWMPARRIPILIHDRYEIAILRTGQQVSAAPLERALVGHSAWIGALSFSPTSSLLASGASDNRICLWDPGTCACRANIGEHGGFVYDIRFSPTGESLVSASGDGTVRLWTVSNLLNAGDGNHPADLNSAMLKANNLRGPGVCTANNSAQTLVDYLLSGPGDRIAECAMWFDRNLPSQRSRIELVSEVTHILQVRIEQAYRELDEPRAGYLNWIRLTLCARLGPASPNGTYGDRQFPDQVESARLATTWLRSKLDLHQTGFQRREVYSTLAVIYQERLESGDDESYRYAVSSLENAAALVDPKQDVRRAAILYRDLGDVHFQQNAWMSAHSAYVHTTDFIQDLISVTFTMKDLQLLVGDFMHVFSNDAYALVQLERYQDAVLVLDQGKTRFINPVLGHSALAIGGLADKDKEEIRRACWWILRREEEMNATDSQRRSDDELREELRLAHLRLRALIESALRASGLDEETVFDLSWQLITGLIPEHGAMIATLTTTKGGGAFVIPHQQTTLTKEHFVELQGLTWDAVRTLLHGAGGVETGWIEPFSELTEQGWPEKVDRIGAKIWDMFIEKIYERIVKFGITSRATLVVIPSSGLGLVPWKAAYRDVSGQRQYPLGSYVISFSPSIYVLRASLVRSEESARSTGNRRRVLVSSDAASPEFHDSSHAFFSSSNYSFSFESIEAEPVSRDPSILAIVDPSGDLEYARAERELIFSLFAPSQSMDLSYHSAWLVELERWAPGYNYLHFACHAVYNYFDPMSSYLLLEGQQRLTFGQIIASLNLYAARLVVLSACESGLTQSRSADEHLGLGAGFLLAGAPAILSTLWPVDDASTMLMIQRFYYLHLQEKLSPAAALASAQEWLMAQTNEELAEFFSRYCASPSEALSAASRSAFDFHVKSDPKLAPYKHPYHWAGFTLVGI
jgi:CHAT domain-containing protein